MELLVIPPLRLKFLLELVLLMVKADAPERKVIVFTVRSASRDTAVRTDPPKETLAPLEGTELGFQLFEVDQ